ncbi:MAG: PD40 domain-containing protein [Candidatus Eisenbacteria sp.]|nr:PD40 domain-containing protein [Candidatus Eisenbacteria bacterium]
MGNWSNGPGRWRPVAALGWALAICGASGGALLAPSMVEAGSDEAIVVMPRHPAPSPAGDRIAFSYQGDIWIVSSEGGTARRVTVHVAHDDHPRWSPDGAWIAFASDRAGTFDIYLLPVAGGELRQLTWNSYQDIPTDWTPDSRAVIFRSWRYVHETDSPGIFCASLDGGTPVALIPAGGEDAVLAPDGRQLVFTRGGGAWSRRNYQGNARHRLWLCDLDPPVGVPGSGGLVRPAGAGLPEAIARESCTAAGMQAIGALRPAPQFRNLTALASLTEDPRRQRGEFWAEHEEQAPDWRRPDLETGINRWPAWFPDGEHVLYLSESKGVSNLKVLAVQSGSRAWVTRLRKGRLRFPTLAHNGRLAAFEYEDGIYTVAIPAALPADGSSQWPEPVPEPERLAIRIPLDHRMDRREWLAVRSGADEMALSPDGKQIAFVYAGEVFVMKASDEEPYAYNVSNSPAREGDIAWAPNSDSLIFVSDRDGRREIYQVTSGDEDESRLARTLLHEVTRLTDSKQEEWTPKFSPDGEQIAFRRGNGTLMVMDADGSDERALVESPREITFAWSPDGKWLAYTLEDDDYNTDVWVLPLDGHHDPVNISQHPDWDGAPYWSADGRMIAFESMRAYLNQADIWYVWLTREDEELSREERLDAISGDKPEPKTDQPNGEDKDASGDAREDGEEADEEDDEAEEDEVEVRIDFEDIYKRVHRLTTLTGNESNVLISKESTELVFVAEQDGERDLWKIKWDGSEPERLTRGGQEPQYVQWNENGEKLFYLKKGGGISAVPLSGGESKSYTYEAEILIDRAEQRRFVFEEAWRALRDHFYDPDFHGCDWDAMRKRYRPWALGASTYRDFQEVIEMMMGELNASHLGMWDGPGDPKIRGSALEVQTGELGIILDAGYRGPGVRVGHVIKGSPADRVESRLEAGEIVRAVNHVSLGAEDNLWRHLTRAVDKPTLLEVENMEGARRQVVIRPISGRDLRGLVYEEAVEARRRCVAEASDGEVAYIHVRRMGIASLDTYERDLYAEAHGKEALIIDVRNNGGGWTTDLLLTSLMAADHATTIGRGGGSGYPEGRRLLYAWAKPIVVLCNEHSFSNAEIFSWAIRALERGPVVGQQTHGGVVSTGGIRLLDGAWVRLPGRGWYSNLDGSNLEGTGCLPDIEVENPPGAMVRGVDHQLERAIAEALRQIE